LIFHFFSTTDTALSSITAIVYFFIDARAKKVSIWQLAKEAAKDSSGFTNSFLPRYSGAAAALTNLPPSNFQLWVRS
jgi:hypothetical protein